MPEEGSKRKGWVLQFSQHREKDLKRENYCFGSLWVTQKDCLSKKSVFIMILWLWTSLNQTYIHVFLRSFSCIFEYQCYFNPSGQDFLPLCPLSSLCVICSVVSCLLRVRMGHGKLGKSWKSKNFKIQALKTWKISVGHGKSWKIRFLLDQWIILFQFSLLTCSSFFGSPMNVKNIAKIASTILATLIVAWPCTSIQRLSPSYPSGLTEPLFSSFRCF